MSNASPLGLFEAFGVELEYAIVRADNLDVFPVCDKLIEAADGSIHSDVERGDVAWSNELVLHVVELKTNGPRASLAGLAERFEENLAEIAGLLAPMGGRLMPTAMHPWMDPKRETTIWPHEYSEIYKTYDRIFDCKGHGWANLQSAHINLPFANDAQFGRLHAAIRLILPLLPALAASSPVVELKATGLVDNRLDYYMRNQKRVPAVAGEVVPERVYTEAEYGERIYARIRRDIAPLDPEGVLEQQFLNSRGAIARFERGAIEIRLIDLQECPKADLAVVALVVESLRDLVAERWTSWHDQGGLDETRLRGILDQTVARGDEAVIADADYLRQLGLAPQERMTAGEVWRHLAEAANARLAGHQREVATLLRGGPLSRRIARALGSPEPGAALPREKVAEVYGHLCDVLAKGEMFEA